MPTETWYFLCLAVGVAAGLVLTASWIGRLAQQQAQMMTKELQVLIDAIEATTVAQTAVAAAYTELAQQFAAHKDDPAKLQELSDKLTASTVALRTAVGLPTPPAPVDPAPVS